ncbi:MAG: N-acetylglutaminylglutamine amidotransferase [Gammaproteobacteria bacterium]|nr:N-acetylglutaminylglutamine amidotransferase [Gammaproteobacteria bacterium]MBU1623627.1 N-acetylglutaminylglutamine amidotransferase [Gammaproteobacteria bacterium]
MCGLCGELRFDKQTPDHDRLMRMTDALIKRGPDASGVYADGPLAFGHRRLSIIDLSDRSRQPMVDEALHLTLVFNGTLYNYRELRAELQEMGYEFFSDGDSEVILKAYHVWGEHCVTHFYGMFAFAIWDQRDHTLFMARDRFGIKPFYYTLDSASLRFASSTQALLAGGGIDTSIDPIALHHHLTLHSSVPAPRTLLNGIRKLPQAHWMRISAKGDIELKRYWELDATRPDVALSEQDWLNATRHVLKKVVERHRLAADVPVGVLLSGGLDSSLIVALLADHVPDLRTFSIGFEDLGGDAEKGDEFEYSDQVVARYHTQHHKMLIPNSEVLKRLPEAVRSMSEPMVSQDNIAFYLLAEQVSKDVKVVLAGQGADEVFAGYFWYPKMDEAGGDALDKFRNHYFDRDHAEYLETVSDAYRTEDVTSELVARELSKPNADEFLDQVLRFDVSTLVVDDPVKRMDNQSMAWGLEARVPFLDHELVELAAKMPPSLRLKEGGKFPLKAIARGLIPDSVIDRPKGYFPVPALKYVRGEFLQFMRDILLSEACLKRGLFNQAYVEKLLAEPESHFTRLNGSKLWHLALLEYWLQLNVDPCSEATS